MNNNGYAICFNEWIFDNRIRNELSLLLLISSLTAESGYCFASNQYFAEKFDLDEVSICRKIKKLEKCGYIRIDYEKRGCEVIKRYIRLTKMLTDDLQKNQSTINKNVKDNNTSINNTSIIYKKATLVTDDWQPDEATRQKLFNKGLDVAKVVDNFINSCQAKNLKYINHNRAILAWHFDERTFGRKKEDWERIDLGLE